MEESSDECLDLQHVINNISAVESVRNLHQQGMEEYPQATREPPQIGGTSLACMPYTLVVGVPILPAKVPRTLYDLHTGCECKRNESRMGIPLHPRELKLLRVSRSVASSN